MGIDLQSSKESRLAVGRRITEFYTNERIERADFTRRMKIKYETFRSYERGVSSPPPLFFSKLREEFPHADIGYILTGQKTVPIGYKPEELVPVRAVPVVDEIPPEGFPDGIPEHAIIDWVGTTNLKEDHLFALLVDGDDMGPEAKEGDHVILAPRKEVESGELYAVFTTRDKSAMLRRVFKNETGYRLVSKDKRYESIVIKTNELKAVYKLVNIFRNIK